MGASAQALTPAEGGGMGTARGTRASQHHVMIYSPSLGLALAEKKNEHFISISEQKETRRNLI